MKFTKLIKSAHRYNSNQLSFDSINGGIIIIPDNKNNKIKVNVKTWANPTEFDNNYSLKIDSNEDYDQLEQKITEYLVELMEDVDNKFSAFMKNLGFDNY